MVDRPILFSAPMVRALLAGTKTQTRRVLTHGNTFFNGRGWSKLAKAQTWNWDKAWVDPGPSPAGNPGPYLKLPWLAGDSDLWEQTTHRLYPVIQPGDRLYVREAFRVNSWATDVATIFYKASERGSYTEMCEQFPVAGHPYLKPTPGGWRPGLHMPRWASRLTLTVTEVRVQRLQDISEEDAEAEGIERIPLYGMPGGWVWKSYDPTHAPHVGWVLAVQSYQSLWNSLNDARGFGWDANPWVVAVSFTVDRRNIDAR